MSDAGGQASTGQVIVPTADDMARLGREIGRRCRAGDLVILGGDLGAGKTTFTQGLAAGLGIEDRITSPTFVIARVHANPGGGPGLVHVDAYRLGSALELDDLDLGADLAGSVVVVEWGGGVAESLAPERLELTITRSDDEGDDTRGVLITGRGPRWATLPSELTEMLA